MSLKLKDIGNLILKSRSLSSALEQKDISGLPAGLKAFLVAYLAEDKPQLCVITDAPDELANDISVWTDKRIETIPEKDFSPALLTSLSALLKNEKAIFVVSPRKDLPSPEIVEKSVISLRLNKRISSEGGSASGGKDLNNKLSDFGFTRVGTVEEPGEFVVRGGIVDLWSPDKESPLRIELMDDQIVSMRTFDPILQTSISKIEEVEIFPVKLSAGETDLSEYLSKTPNLLSINAGEGHSSTTQYYGNIKVFQQELGKIKDHSIFIFCKSEVEKIRIAEIFSKVEIRIANLSTGFILPDIKLAVFTEQDIFGEKVPLVTPHKAKPFHPFKGQGAAILDIQALQPNNFIVHIDYGIGIYQGIKKLEIPGIETDCLLIKYKNGDLYVPIDKFKCIERWVGDEDRPPELSSLGSEAWHNKKEKAKKSIEDLTKRLLSLYAERKVSKGYSFSNDTIWQAELEASFPYEETEDQLKVLSEIKGDMESVFPMDKLVCGEVGYGKTELALRAAFKAVMDGKQVAILCPTTILTEQHFRTFRERLKTFPVLVEQLSRFQKKSQKKIIEGLQKGKVDIIIGTQRLLSKDIKFNDLGLLIIDEEHRFGVKQKEKLKEFKKNIDVLSLTATPIPRTLYMALSNIRSLAQLETPPRGRLSVITRVAQWDDSFIKQAIEYELHRGGQIYFVHNRIETILGVANEIRGLNPSFRIGIAHSEISEKELELVMMQFMEKEIDILLSTAIIGSGIDIPNVNTIIINRADMFGLADLHQLRGRVGRSLKQAYCYLIIPDNITPDAKKRVQSVVTFSELGAGFKIALRDLSFRGAGNLLGREQHGHIRAIGYELYETLLDAEIRNLTRSGRDFIQKAPEKLDPELKLKVSSFLPDSYVDPMQKFSLYKRLSTMDSIKEINDFSAELVDRFGKLPMPASQLLDCARIKILAKEKGIIKIASIKDGFMLKFINPDIKTFKNCNIIKVNYAESGLEIHIKAKNIQDLKRLLLTLDSK